MRCAIVVAAASLAVLSIAIVESSAQSLDGGRKEYESRCAGCHGADGEGSGHGPGFVGGRSQRARSRAELRELIRKGIPDAGMPAFPLSEGELDAIAAYTEALRAPAADRPLPGNAEIGQTFFTGKGGCGACHMIQGRGGIFGPDLSNLARDRRVSQIERTFSPAVDARSASPRRVTIRMRDGRTVQAFA